MISKSDTINEIRTLNPTANPGFLAEFSSEELSRYLCRLKSAQRRTRCNPTKPGRPLDPPTANVAAPARTF